jgi:protein O-GlcNAc transferase
VRAALCVLLCVLVSGCAGRRLNSAATPPSTPSLADYIAKVRKLSAEARPDRPGVKTIEASDPALIAALAGAALTAAPAAYRQVADEYRRRGIVDKAHEYLNRALALDRNDAATYDALARLWRDSGLPHVALADAYRAVHHAPHSAVARNTLGTIFQALGDRKAARRQYQQALQRDPDAVYALNNLCYTWVLEDEAQQAITACRRALDLQPGLAAAHHNLALAFAVAGKLAEARTAFAASGDRARSEYNLGIVRLARRQYGEAVKAFEAAQAVRPGFRAAEARARQARSHIPVDER